MGKVIITITPDGNVKFEHRGFTGKACDKASAELKADLGGTSAGRVNLPEYHQQAKAPNQARANQ